MFKNVEQFAAANKASVDAMVSLASTALNSAEQITALNLNMANLLLENGAANTKAILDAKNLQDVMAQQTAKSQPIMDQLASYSRSYYEIMSQSKENVTQLLDSQFAEYQKQVSGFLDKVGQNTPAGSEAAVASVKAAFAAVNAAFENMNKAVKAAGDVAETYFTTVSNTAANAAPSSTASKKKST